MQRESDRIQSRAFDTLTGVLFCELPIALRRMRLNDAHHARQLASEADTFDAYCKCVPLPASLKDRHESCLLMFGIVGHETAPPGVHFTAYGMQQQHRGNCGGRQAHNFGDLGDAP